MNKLVWPCLIWGAVSACFFLFVWPDTRFHESARSPDLKAQYQEALENPRTDVHSKPEVSSTTIDEAFEFGRRCSMTPGLTMELCSMMCLNEYQSEDEHESCTRGLWYLMNEMSKAANAELEAQRKAELELRETQMKEYEVRAKNRRLQIEANLEEDLRRASELAEMDYYRSKCPAPNFPENTDYNIARSAILSAGFRPSQSPENWLCHPPENSIGNVCNEYPEIRRCFSNEDATCAMEFDNDAGERLFVTTKNGFPSRDSPEVVVDFTGLICP